MYTTSNWIANIEYHRIKLDVLVNGKSVKKYSKDGKIFIEGRTGSEYSLKLKNTNVGRVLAVVAIDSVNVIDGKPAHSDGGPGYIIDGLDEITVYGYRVDNDNSAKFIFTEKHNAYASGVSIETALNSGVISVQIYDEVSNNLDYVAYTPHETKTWPAPTPPYQVTFTDNTGASSNNEYLLGGTNIISEKLSINCRANSNYDVTARNAFELGTTWGNKHADRVYETSFSRNMLKEQITIYYTSKAGLTELGIQMKPVKYIALPKATVNEPVTKFAIPPKGWTG